jgi:hypothetical protein
VGRSVLKEIRLDFFFATNVSTYNVVCINPSYEISQKSWCSLPFCWSGGALAGCDFITFSTDVGVKEATLSKGYDREKSAAINPTTTFGTSDKIVYCIVKFNAPEASKLRAEWFVVKAENAPTGELLIAKDIDNVDGKMNVADFSLTAENGLPAANYRCDIYLNPKGDGIQKPDKSLSFTVK